MITMWKLIKFQDSWKKYFFHWKKDKILKKSRKILQKTEHVKKSKLLNNSVVSKCVIKS